MCVIITKIEYNYWLQLVCAHLPFLQFDCAHIFWLLVTKIPSTRTRLIIIVDYYTPHLLTIILAVHFFISASII
jgi:hypothetical protein